MYNLIYNWWHRPARWWQFWQPQSGLGGAIVMNAIGIPIICLILYIT